MDSTLKVICPLTTWSHVTWLIRKVTFPLPQELEAPNLLGWWPMVGGLSLIKSHVHLPYRHMMLLEKYETFHLHFQKIVKRQTWHSDHLGKGFPTRKVISWSRGQMNVTWQISNTLFRLPQDLLPSNLAEWWLRVTGSHLLSHMTLFSYDLKLKTLCLLFH